jgi:hypothetical protein
MTNMPHEHQLVLIRDPMDEYQIYWCRDCGLIFEKFVTGAYEMLPTWSRERLLKEDRRKERFTIVQRGLGKSHEQRLGKSLRDIKVPLLDNLARTLFGKK